MSKFKDKTGAEWSINLDVGLIEDIKEATGIDFDALIQEPKKLSEMLFTSPRKVVEVLWSCCTREPGKGEDITPREFARRFDREILDLAINALLESIMLFYPRTSVGKVIRENLPQMIQEMDKKMSIEAELRVKKVLSNIATGLPES